MAVAYDTGVSGGGTTTATLSWAHVTGAGANAILVAANLDDSNNYTMTATCNGTGMTSLGLVDTTGLTNLTGYNAYIQLFLATTSVLPGASNAIVVTASHAPQYDLNGGSVSFTGYTGHGTVATGYSAATLTVAANTSGNVIAGFFAAGNTITQAGGAAHGQFLDNYEGNGPYQTGNTAGATSPATGASVTITWATSAVTYCSIGVEMQGAAAAAAAPVPQYAQPGETWTGHFRAGSRRPFVTQSAGTPPPSTLAVAGTASASATAQGATTSGAPPPGPQYAQPGPAWREQFRHPQQPVPPAATSAPPYITGVAGTPGPGWFTNTLGAPALWVATETWGLPTSAGAWSGSGGGTWQQDYDNFFAARAAQGFTVVMTDPVWAEVSKGTRATGDTWDGLTPLTSGTDPTATTLNSAFWARIDYMFSSAAKNGITIGLCICNVGDDIESGNWQYSWSAAEWTAWGTLVATRYKTQQNLIWLVGNDSFSPYNDSQFNAVYSGVTSTGDSHMWAPWYNAECTARYETDTNGTEDWGVSYAAFNFVYTYNAGYFCIEYAYNEVAAGLRESAAGHLGRRVFLQRHQRRRLPEPLRPGGTAGVVVVPGLRRPRCHGRGGEHLSVVVGCLCHRRHRQLVLQQQREKHRHHIHRAERVVQAVSRT